MTQKEKKKKGGKEGRKKGKGEGRKIEVIDGQVSWMIFSAFENTGNFP